MKELMFSVKLKEDGDIRNVDIEAFGDEDEVVEFAIEDVVTILELMYDQVSDHMSNMYDKDARGIKKHCLITC